MVKKQQRKQSASPKDESHDVVIYVHGIGSHLPKEALKLEWDLALFGSDRGPLTRMAYWSDIVHPSGVKRPTRKDKADTIAGPLRPEEILEEAGINARNAKAHEFALRMLAAYGQAEVITGARKKVIPLPSFVREPISRVFLKRFIADTAAYFFNDTKRQRIRQRLVAELPAQRTPVTIVAHSQGSIVAVEVLSAMTNISVVKLVTIGSPLGLQEVQDYLEVPPRSKPFWAPRVVERWHNFADPLDPVALDKRLAADFVVHPGSHDDVILDATPITDEIIVNERTFRLREFNPHSAVGYLSHPKVRRSVYESTHFDSMARFVVARDVAEVLGVEQRHPVLIEALEPGYPALGEHADERERREQQEQSRTPISLAGRIERAASDLRTVVRDVARDSGASVTESRRAVEEARIDVLRRFVAAHLTPAEIRKVAHEHRQFNVYAVWRSAAKKKLLHRSRAVLQADAALESYSARGQGITWAVLDTGVQSNHPHFTRRIAAIWDCTRTGPPARLAADEDRDGHGSHVAGIVAGASEKEGQTISGVAPEAKLVIYKVLNDRGEGEDAWIIKALDHIAAQNENNASMAIHGLNLSLGGPYDSTVYGCGFTPICQELRRQWRSGVLVVVACGNEGQLEVQTRGGDVEINTAMSIGDPANLEDCIAVGSVNADRPHLYGISAFSSRGPTSDGRCKPDVVAPGERITSVNARFTGAQRLHRVESGTSMAAPHVSGLLAAFLSVRREFIGRPDEVKKILLDTCTDIGRDRHHQGRGIPNLMKMLLSV